MGKTKKKDSEYNYNVDINEQIILDDNGIFVNSIVNSSDSDEEKQNNFVNNVKEDERFKNFCIIYDEAKKYILSLENNCASDVYYLLRETEDVRKAEIIEYLTYREKYFYNELMNCALNDTKKRYNVNDLHYTLKYLNTKCVYYNNNGKFLGNLK